MKKQATGTGNRNQYLNQFLEQEYFLHHIEYFLPKLEIKDCNAMLDEQNFVISQRKLT